MPPKEQKRGNEHSKPNKEQVQKQQLTSQQVVELVAAISL